VALFARDGLGSDLTVTKQLNDFAGHGLAIAVQQLARKRTVTQGDVECPRRGLHRVRE
jgi:hypothetical protein